MNVYTHLITLIGTAYVKARDAREAAEFANRFFCGLELTISSEEGSNVVSGKPLEESEQIICIRPEMTVNTDSFQESKMVLAFRDPNRALHRAPAGFRAPPQRIADLMITAVEGGIGHWADDLAVMVGTHPDARIVSYSDANSYNGDGWRVVGVDCVTNEEWSFTAREFHARIGERLFGNQHVADWLGENEDAETADVLIQIAAFDEIRFG